MIHRFGEFELDERAWELRRGGNAVELQPKVLELLFHLVRHRDRVVTRGELVAAVWRDTTVTESSVTRAVSLARLAIGDRDRAGGVIQTIARKGYRFCAPVVTALPSDSPTTRDPFVGRESLLARLEQMRSHVMAGQGSLALLTGGAGIGKTRAAEELADRFGASGARVAFARGDAGEGAPPFWLWVQALRQLSREDSVGAASSIANFVPAMALQSFDAGEVGEERRRFQLFERICEFIGDRCRSTPLALVLDDVQLAGAPSLMLLEHLAARMRQHPLLVIATLRDERRQPDHPVEHLLGALARHGHCQRIALSPLSEQDVCNLVEATLPGDAPPGLARQLHARSEGNPLFVREMLHLAATDGDAAGNDEAPLQIPPGVRDVIGRRLSRLPDDCREALEIAATAGREVDLQLCAIAAASDVRDWIRLLDGAVDEGILRESHEGIGGYVFSHGLVREVVYAGLKPGRRAELHLRMADALESLHRENLDEVLADLAHHYHAAYPTSDLRKAAEYAIRAGDQASAVLAHEQAAALYQRAGEALEQVQPRDEGRRLDAMLGLGVAHLAVGNHDPGREALRRAARLAASLGRPEAFAEAALGYCAPGEWRAADETACALLEEALRRLGDSAGGLRARLLSRLAHVPRMAASGRSDSLSRDALELALSLGEPEPLCEALHARHFVLEGPAHLAERETLAREICQLAGQCGRPELAAPIHLEYAIDRLAVGDRAGFDRESRLSGEMAADFPHAVYAWSELVTEAGIALLEGRFEDAEPLIGEGLAAGGRAEQPFAGAVFVAHTYRLLRDRGRLAQIAPLLESFEKEHGWTGAYVRTVPALIHTEIGDLPAARATFERLAHRPFSEWPVDSNWALSMMDLTDVCTGLKDAKRAESLYAQIRPYSDQHAVMPYTVSYGGPLSHSLGLLSGVLGRSEEAARWFTQAIASAEALGARPAALRARFELARLQAAAGDPAAGGRLESARKQAASLGMEGLERAAALEGVRTHDRKAP